MLQLKDPGYLFIETLGMLALGDEMPLSRPSYLTVCCVHFT